jgi:hypothetical protein
MALTVATFAARDRRFPRAKAMLNTDVADGESWIRLAALLGVRGGSRYRAHRGSDRNCEPAQQVSRRITFPLPRYSGRSIVLL